jgi:hypothetical protein
MVDLMDERAINEMSSGTEKDLRKLFNIMEEEAIKIYTSLPEPITSDKFFELSYFTQNLDESLKVLNYNYFKTTMLPDFQMGWHNIEWGQLVQLYPYLAILAARSEGKSFEFSYAQPLWKMYGYRKPTDMNPIDRQTELRREGLIITNEYKLGKRLLEKVVEEIKINPLLKERLKPEIRGEGELGKQRIETRNGCTIELRSADSSPRGLHPGWVDVDDLLDESSLYSQEQRDKMRNYFYSDIMKALEKRGGTITVIGTPFHDRDLYYNLRNDKQFKFFEYPAIFPDGTLTAPNRWSFEDLDKEYKSNGSIIFSRELLVVPVSDASTIFPWSILENAFRGMHNYTLVTNRDSFPVKFKYVTVGCDFAISANIGSDSSVFSVWGEDEYGCYWLLYIWKGQGKSHLEQIAKIKEIERNFRPDEIVAEKNGFQQIMLNIAYEHGVKAITPFTTDGWNKKDLKEGLPGLAILFEQSRIKLPRGDQHSIEQSDWLCGEFNTITIKPDSGKLESAGGHDDGPMSSFLGIKGSSMNKKKTNFEFSFA